MKTAEQFENALIELVSQRSIDEVSIEMLCEKVGVKRQTFYYHYRDLADLLDSIFITATEQDANAENSLVGDAYFAIEFISKHHLFLHNIIDSSYLLVADRFIRNYVYSRSYARLCTNRKYRLLIDDRMRGIARIVASVFIAEISNWIKSGFIESKEEFLHRFEVIMRDVDKCMLQNLLREARAKKRAEERAKADRKGG